TQYSDIRVLYPVFSGSTFVLDRYKLQPNRFDGIVVVRKDGKRAYIGWSYKVKDEDPDGFDTFKEFLRRGPRALERRYSPIPVPSKKEFELIKELERDEKNKKKVTKKDLFGIIVPAISMVMIVYGFIVLALLEEDVGLNNFLGISGIISLALGFIPLTYVMLKQDRRSKGLQKARDLRDQIELADIRERKKALQTLRKLDYNVDTSELTDDRPFSREIVKNMSEISEKSDLKKAVRIVRHYDGKRVRNAVLLTTYLFLLSIIFAVDMLNIVWMIVTIAVTSVIFLGVLIYCIAKFSLFTIDDHRRTLRDALADEVRLNRDILPSKFEPPSHVLIARGRNPIIKGSLQEFRKWSKRSDLGIILLLLFAFTAGILVEIAGIIVLELTRYPLEWELAIIFIVPLFATVLFWLGSKGMSDQTKAQSTVRFLEDWEKRTGKKVLPDDIRPLADKVLRGKNIKKAKDDK
ncbi:MAG: hypothetical protein ACMUHM_08215, partial [Thermoplasmatota archaeon]